MLKGCAAPALRALSDFSFVLTLAPRNKVTPDRGFSACSPHYVHDSRKRIADSLSGGYRIDVTGENSIPVAKMARLRSGSFQPEAWDYG
jgi:hypothetical protein